MKRNICRDDADWKYLVFGNPFPKNVSGWREPTKDEKKWYEQNTSLIESCNNAGVKTELVQVRQFIYIHTKKDCEALDKIASWICG